MVMGNDGWDQWRARSKRRVEADVAIAIDASTDQSLSWTARICAMAIANDIIGLQSAFNDPENALSGIGAAMAEQCNDDDEDDDFDPDEFEPVPIGHPFYWLCRYPRNMMEDVYDEDQAFITCIAFAAALTGSIGSLQYLESLLGSPLWTEHFDEKGDGFLKSLVVVACGNQTLDCVVDSVAAIFPGKYSSRFADDGMLHLRHRGGNGNHLHLAAARGHKKLVKVLIEGGMNPNKRCERIQERIRDFYDYDSDESSSDSVLDARDRGVKEYPLPENWAKVRGHEDVAELIYSYSRGGGMTDGVKRGYAKRFNEERGFGFIKPNDGSKDVFVHISDIDNSVPLEENERVEFKTEISNKGTRAVNVVRVGSMW